MKKIIAIDADRTLVNSYESDLMSFQEAIENALNIKLSEDEIVRLTTWPTKDFIDSLNLTDEEVEKVKKEWEKTYVKYKTECFKEMIKLVKELFNRGYNINIITSRNNEEFHELDKALEDIIDLINIVVTSDLVDSPKPSIDSMNYLCDKLKCTSNDVIYIGDSQVDKDFAINSKCTFIPACWENKLLINDKNACHNPMDILKLL